MKDLLLWCLERNLVFFAFDLTHQFLGLKTFVLFQEGIASALRTDLFVLTGHDMANAQISQDDRTDG